MTPTHDGGGLGVSGQVSHGDLVEEEEGDPAGSNIPEFKRPISKAVLAR